MGCNLGTIYIHSACAELLQHRGGAGKNKGGVCVGSGELEMTFPNCNAQEQNFEEHMILIQAWPPDCL